MDSPPAATSGVARGWRWAALGLATTLVASWALFGYAVLDGGVSLTYCRAEQEHQEHDIAMLVEAGKGRLSSDAFLAARGGLEPELPRRLDEGNTLLLRTVTLRFGEDGVLRGLAERP
jgi:hypothetical protein